MKKSLLQLALFITLSVTFSSCYTYTMTVGKGAQGSTTVTEKNHYLIYGLAPLTISDPQKMAGGAQDYTVTVQHTFVDGLLNAITFGIYTPTTTVVKK